MANKAHCHGLACVAVNELLTSMQTRAFERRLVRRCLSSFIFHQRMERKDTVMTIKVTPIAIHRQNHTTSDKRSINEIDVQ